ncbi:MAG TPA: ATP-binding protein, partial [Bacteroidales bacterium]|nr:ATP-binding protein [Bacteroidales bacterium]
ITNLLSNAIKFTHEGFVEFGVRSKEGYMEFFVKDTGIGISPADVAVIFEPFRQVENNNSRMYGGNGLGLSISKALVEKLGWVRIKTFYHRERLLTIFKRET